MAPSSPTTSRRWSLRSAREKDLSWSPHPQGSPAFCPHLKPQGQHPRAAGCPEAQQGLWHGGDSARCPLCPETTKLGVSSAGQCCYPKSLEQKHSWSETAPGPSWLQGASPDPHHPFDCLFAVYEMVTPLPWGAAAPQKPAHMAESSL